MAVDVAPVTSGSDLHRFVTFPWKVYRGDPTWVPPLIRDEKKLLSPGKHPFHDHGEIRCFLARAAGGGGKARVVGRVAAIRNTAYEEFHRENVGFFGFFECLPTSARLAREGVAATPEAITKALVDAVRGWLGDRGLARFLGPMNPSTNETCGLLIDGFDDPPMVMMTYNPAEYAGLLQSAGLVKAKDMVAYIMADVDPPDALLKRVEAVVGRSGVKVRTLDKKNMREEIRRIQKVYNGAWEKNWGFVPMTQPELDHMAKELMPIVEPEYVAFVEKDGEPIGFCLALPDFNMALRHANGRLFPFGLLKILWYSRKIDRLRVLALGLLPEYRKLGIDQLLYLQLWRSGRRKGIRQGEFSWILEDNAPMRTAVEKMGSKVAKTYRIYEGSAAGAPDAP